MSCSGKLCDEVEVNVAASQAWELYGTLKLSKLVEEELSSLFQKIEVLEGDGGVGTLLNIVYAPGGKLCDELVVDVAASHAWELYGTLKLSKLVEEEFSSLFQKIELLEGDGGVGTLLNLVFVPGTALSYTEKFTKIDNENRIKETEIVEGGFLDLGFTVYRVHMEIIEKEEETCIIKSEIEYQLKEEMASNASIVTIQPLAEIAKIAKKYLVKHKP